MSVNPSPRPFSEPSPLSRSLAAIVVVLYAVVSILPLAWIGATAFSRRRMRLPIPRN